MMYRLRGANRNNPEDADHHQQNDPKQMWIALSKRPSIGPIAVSRIQLLWAELCRVDRVRQREQTRIVVLRSVKRGIPVIQNQRLSAGNIETDLPLSDLEPDTADRKRRVVAVVDRDFNGRGTLHVRAQSCRNTELLLPDLAARLGKVDAVNRPGDAFASKAGAGLRTISNPNITAEVRLVPRC